MVAGRRTKWEVEEKKNGDRLEQFRWFDDRS